MSRNPSALPSVYDSMNHELKTVRDYFAERDTEVLDIKWEEGIVEGAQISSGQLLAYIIWDGAPREPLKAPAGCGGRIEWINGQIAYELLDLRSEVLLRLEAA